MSRPGSAKSQYDAVIVGAGPAGATAGYLLAKAGMDVLILERGDWPGAKNVSGCVFRPQELARILPGFWEEAPIERRVARQSFTLLDARQSLSISFDSEPDGQAAGGSVLVVRAQFDRWLAEQAARAGAAVVPGCPVDDVLTQNGRVVGVHVNRPDGDVYGRVVIAADGVNSIVARRASLATELRPDQVASGVREYIALPERHIDERFGLAGGAGLVSHWVGSGPRGIEAAGFLYTMKAGLALGVVARLSALTRHRVSITELFHWFRGRGEIARLIEGGQTREYSAHLIPEGGFNALPRLYADGILLVGDAAHFVVSTGLLLKGMNLAIASGMAAAETILAARETNLGTAHLKHYATALRKRGLLQEMKAYRRAPDLLAESRLFQTYPRAACQFAREILNNADSPRPKIWQVGLRAIRRGPGLRRFVWDALRVGRSL